MSKNKMRGGYGNGGTRFSSKPVSKYTPSQTPIEEIRRREALPKFTAPSNGLPEVKKDQFPRFGFRPVRRIPE